MDRDCCSIQLIDRAGNFNEEGLENFTKTIKLAECGLSYAVVSIMGPQSSGKSTLLNHLFKTNFREMDAYKGRNQTTQGIWFARAPDMDPCTLVMDLEGSDGRERGEDDTTFEKQSALFALAVSDVVLVNLWCHDIGREHAANKPLLKTVFQVMMRLFSPRKATLMFVIRDKTKTPSEVLEDILREDIQKIWDNIVKPPQHKGTPLSDFFNVDVSALPSYELQERDFKEKVVELRSRFFNSIAPGGLAGDRTGVVPASAFPFSVKQIWTVIRDNKDLDLPAHKVMVATVRCEALAKEKFEQLKSDKAWLELERDTQSGPVKSFGKRLSALLSKYFSDYDAEAAYFDEGVREAKRQHLVSNSLNLVYPAYQAMLGHIRSKSLDLFKKELENSLNKGEEFAASVRKCEKVAYAEFDCASEDATVQQASWDGSKIRKDLSCDIGCHAASVRAKMLSETKERLEKHLIDALSEPVATLLETGTHETWPAIRKLLKHELDKAASDFTSAVNGLEIDDETKQRMVEDLTTYAKGVVKNRVCLEAGQVLTRMKERFSSIFIQDADGMPRVWTGKEDIRSITKKARTKSLKLLASMAVLRLEEKTDNVEKVLSSALLDSADIPGTKHERTISTAVTPLASSTWEEIPPSDTIITPAQCQSIWRQFKAETDYLVGQAIAAQKASKQRNSHMPPPWAIAALLVLGFNEFMMLLRNPLYLGLLFVILLLGRALWIQLDVTGAFEHGIVSGFLQLCTKFLPTVFGMLKRLTDEVQSRSTNAPITDAPQQLHSSESSSKISTSQSTVGCST